MYLQSSETLLCCFQGFLGLSQHGYFGLEGKEMILGLPFTRLKDLQMAYVSFHPPVLPLVLLGV